ncbi:hypothetical protein SKAU_G00084040 [Synaphobranchus kaupii]|uniref:Uncharacterized protein n=1 Tax=Synaphobranchus kaupii TaxID=118154 RepID=A0A9Q1FW96_SYNKA|nr:hypothetical protein SKAU_G00084040 [Synaphobranchus kaupii]
MFFTVFTRFKFRYPTLVPVSLATPQAAASISNSKTWNQEAKKERERDAGGVRVLLSSPSSSTTYDSLSCSMVQKYWIKEDFPMDRITLLGIEQHKPPLRNSLKNCASISMSPEASFHTADYS